MTRFVSHLKKNLVKINHNLYVSENDSSYYEKLLRYTDPYSPDAHFHQGQKLEKEGELGKALIHYYEAAQIHSPYYHKAKKSISLLEERIHSLENNQHLPQEQKTKIPVFIKIIIACLFILVLILSALLFWRPTISTIASSIKQWDTGIDVVYESVDIPYVIYLPIDTPYEEIEKTLYEKALSLGKNTPKQTLLLYGVLTSDKNLAHQVHPLRNKKLTESAFVMAEFNSSFDKEVKIRFLNKEFQQSASESYPLIFVGTNIVRTALSTYMKENGAPPSSIDKLVQDYPNNFLSFIPNEVQSKSNQISNFFNGEGGWVYEKNAKNIENMFYPNILEGVNTKSISIPYQPVEIDVEKATFSLVVKSSPYIISRKSVGLGKNNSTPIGLFTINNKVLKPIGENPGIFGVAGLGMGDIAIHGTFDNSSINTEKSSGCIRLANQDMFNIFDFIPKGTVVNIHDHTPSSMEELILNSVDQLIPKIKPTIEQHTDDVFNWSA